MTEQEKLIEAIKHSSRGSTHAIALLVHLLEERGLLEKGVYLQALKSTINAPEAEFDRLDYRLLHSLAQILEELGRPKE